MAQGRPRDKDQKLRRQRKRKARTEVSSSSSASDTEESGRETSPIRSSTGIVEHGHQKYHGDSARTEPAKTHTQDVVHDSKNTSHPRKVDANSENLSAEFEAYYLQRITAEFAEELNKIRTADDFHDDSLPILLRALKQGTSIFPDPERQTILRAGNNG